MAIAPFRACRYSLTHEQIREATALSDANASGIGSQVFKNKVAVTDTAPALYNYQHRQDGSRLEGFVALLQGNALEQLHCPMPADPADVLFAREYVTAHREQLAPVLALYDAPPSTGVQRYLPAACQVSELQIQSISDPGLVKELEASVSNSPLTVVSGQEWLEAAGGGRCMALLVNLRACTPELVALHRTVRWNPGWQAGDMVRVGREHFFFHDITHFMPPIAGSAPDFKEKATEYLRPKSPGENVYLAVTAQHAFRVHSLPGWADTILAHRSPEERAVSAVQLHEVLFAKGLQMPPEAVGASQVSYTFDVDEAIARVTKGEADVAFLMNAPTVEQIVAVACTGGSIPPHTFRTRIVPVSGAITYAL